MRLFPQFFVILLQLVSCFVHSCTSCNMSSHNRKACTSGAEWLYSIYKRSILNSYVVQLSDSILEHGIAIESCCCVFLYLVLFIYVSRNCLITIFLKLPPKCLSRNSITCAQETAHPPRHSSHTYIFFPHLVSFSTPRIKLKFSSGPSRPSMAIQVQVQNRGNIYKHYISLYLITLVRNSSEGNLARGKSETLTIQHFQQSS